MSLKNGKSKDSVSNNSLNKKNLFGNKPQFFTIPWGVGIVGKSAKTGNVINIEDAYSVGFIL